MMVSEISSIDWIQSLLKSHFNHKFKLSTFIPNNSNDKFKCKDLELEQEQEVMPLLVGDQMLWMKLETTVIVRMEEKLFHSTKLKRRLWKVELDLFWKL